MKTISLRVDDELADKVSTKAEKLGMNLSDYLRKLMDDSINDAIDQSRANAIVDVLSHEISSSANSLMSNQQDSFLVLLRELLVVTTALKDVSDKRDPGRWLSIQEAANERLAQFLTLE